MNNDEALEPRQNIIYSVIDILKNMISSRYWEQIEKGIPNNISQELIKKKIISILCISCSNDAFNIYNSFMHIIQTDNLKDIDELTIAIAQLKEILRMYGKSYEKVFNEYTNLQVDVNNGKQVLMNIEKECQGLSISKPQFQKKIEAFLKNSDRSEKNLQIILDDLTYLIDRLNRFMKYKQ